MTNKTKLILLKTIHTMIWVFFNIVIFYMLYAVLNNKLDTWFWLGYGLVGIEAAVLLFFKNICPLTILARRYSDSTKDNFDIYLPNWLARFTKPIYTVIMMIIVIITAYQLLK